MPGVFLSYARADGETRAAELRERLAREAPDIEIKQDRLFLEGGLGWWKQITAAIDSVEFVVLIMTPAAIASGSVEKEWRHARERGVCVYPVKGAPDSQLQFEKMPRWMSKAHFFDLEKEWPTFVAHLRRGCVPPRVPFMAPDLPPNFIQRPEEYRALKDLLLTGGNQPVAITTALSGAGGFGKTTLAAALCHDEDIIENFDDGILWVTLGRRLTFWEACSISRRPLRASDPVSRLWKRRRTSSDRNWSSGRAFW
ncbi:MAG TPA: TIR domain-containing protein [Bryobacteraceae bacterium]